MATIDRKLMRRGTMPDDNDFNDYEEITSINYTIPGRKPKDPAKKLENLTAFSALLP
jgi:hypothetical protein